MAYLNFPPLRPYSDEALLPAEVHLPAGALWLDALDYTDLQYATPRPSDNLVYEGWQRGEVRGHGFVNGTGIGCGFGAEAGDQVRYQLSVPRPTKNGMLLVRYRARSGQANFEVRGIVNTSITFEATDDFEVCAVPLGSLPTGEYSFELVSTGDCRYWIPGSRRASTGGSTSFERKAYGSLYRKT